MHVELTTQLMLSGTNLEVFSFAYEKFMIRGLDVALAVVDIQFYVLCYIIRNIPALNVYEPRYGGVFTILNDKP
jgi:hypothetical protein